MKSWGADQESIRIGPLSDIHLGSPQFSERAFTQFLDQVEGDPDFYLVLNGDYIENITRSSIGELWEQRMTPSEQIREVAARLMRVKDRILCVTEGNHELRSRKETSFEPARMLMEKMGLAEELYQPEGAVVVVRLGYCSRENRKTPMVYTLYVTHGSTGGSCGSTASTSPPTTSPTASAATIPSVRASSLPTAGRSTSSPGRSRSAR